MLELNRIYHQDCLEGMKGIADKSIDMILCDLPYGVTQNKWDFEVPLDRLWEQYERIIKDRRGIVLTSSQPFTSKLVLSNIAMFKYEWVWIKNRGSNFANLSFSPMKEHENILVFSAGKVIFNKQMQARAESGLKRVKHIVNLHTKTENYGNFSGLKDKKFSDLRVPSSWQKFNVEVGMHPTQKPVALFEYLIRTYTNEGETVLDNCMGGGTTAVACINTGRNYIGFETESKYCDIANQRISDAMQQRAA